MEWFKHYNKASEGESMELLLAERDFETAFIYWWLLEQVSKFEKSEPEKRGRITLNASYFQRKLHINFQRTSRYLDKIRKTFNLEITINSDESIEVFIPNWLELQENRGGKKYPKLEQSSSKNSQDIRDKNKESRIKAKPPAATFNFLALYEKYPRHEGKSKGLKTCQVQIKTQIDYDRLSKAIDAYSALCKRERKELVYIKTFQTFMNCWTDYLDKNVGAAPAPRNLQAEQFHRDRANIEKNFTGAGPKNLSDEQQKLYQKFTKKVDSPSQLNNNQNNVTEIISNIIKPIGENTK